MKPKVKKAIYVVAIVLLVVVAYAFKSNMQYSNTLFIILSTTALGIAFCIIQICIINEKEVKERKKSKESIKETAVTVDNSKIDNKTGRIEGKNKTNTSSRDKMILTSILGGVTLIADIHYLSSCILTIINDRSAHLSWASFTAWFFIIVILAVSIPILIFVTVMLRECYLEYKKSQKAKTIDMNTESKQIEEETKKNGDN